MKLFQHADGSLSLVQHPAYRPFSNPHWKLRERRKPRRENPFPSLPVNPDHYIEQSKQDFTKIEWYPNERALAQDQRALVNAADYLKRFHPDADEKLLARFKPVEMKITTSADEAEEVYRRGPDSCMQGHREVRAYAADLRVAYLPDFSARTVVWPEKKIFSRIYGKEHAKLRRALTQQGYYDAYSDYNISKTVWTGATVNIEAYLCMPYWDAGGCRINSEEGKIESCTR